MELQTPAGSPLVLFQRSTAPETVDAQTAVNDYFSAQAAYWAEIYQRHGVKEAIHKERLRVALDMAAGLGLAPAARALDIGCGAGLASVGLARQGFLVEAIDPLRVMVDAARRRASEAGVGSRVTARIGDIHAIPFADKTFDLVVALGVLPWLPRIDEPVREMARVLRPDGYVIVSIDTLWQLRHMFDPILNPLMRGLRRQVAHRRGRSSRGLSHVISLRAFGRILESAGFDQKAGVALGFGPFTIFKREALPRSFGLRLNDFLQSLACRDVPILRSCGSQHLVLAQKREFGPEGVRRRFTFRN